MFTKKIENYSDKVDFSVKSIEKGHHKVLFHGIPMIRCPFDYVIYQMLIWEVKPDLIIEIGTNRGGSAYYYATILDALDNGTIHTIDIIEMEKDQRIIDHPRIKLFTEGFEQYDIEEAKKFSKILVIDDGSHTYEDVKKSLDKFNDLVNLNSYFIVEDGIIDKLGMSKDYQGGPNKAIKEFLKKNKSFEIDLKWTSFFGKNATFNTNGYLKKVK
jgi:cephalosporin hydroxylase